MVKKRLRAKVGLLILLRRIIPRGGVFFDRDGRPYVVKHPNWWRPDDQKLLQGESNGAISEYAIYQIAVIPRDLKEERKCIKPPCQPEAIGSELEFAVGRLTEKDLIPLNIQFVIEALKKAGISVSIEGWVSQLEHPSNPKTDDLALSDYKNELSGNLLAIACVLKQFGAYLLPISTIPFSPNDQANFENPYVRNVLMQGMQAALGGTNLQ